MRYSFNGGSPTSVNYTITEEFENANRAVAHSIYLQDQWTRGRMTLQGALRYDHVYSWAPAEGNGTDGTSRFSSTPIRFDRDGERDRAITTSVRGSASPTTCSATARPR